MIGCLFLSVPTKELYTYNWEMTKRKLLVAGIQSDRGIVLVIFSEVSLKLANPAEGKHRQVDKKYFKFADNIIQPTKTV